MKRPALLAALAAVLAAAPAPAGQGLAVAVSNPSGLARPSETIEVPWSRVAQANPGALMHHLVVRDQQGRSLPYQVINVAPEAKDPTGVGVAYGDLVFQHDFAAGEQSASFTIRGIEDLAPVFPSRVFARFVPERYDDFAWENDKVAHRTYGPALAAPDAGGTGKEVNTSSGIDVWSKRVDYLIVDRWYSKGHDHYHRDEGEGMDMYNVGPSRGCGGTGIWDGSRLAVSGNFQGWKVIANGPVRAIFELTYAEWGAGGARVAETKRYTVDAGHNLDQVDSTFTVAPGGAADLTVGIGLDKNSPDQGQDPKFSYTADTAHGTISLWVVHRTHGSLGTAVIVPKESFIGLAEDGLNYMALARATPGRALRFYAGAGWSKAGEFTTKDAWDSYVGSWAARIRSPVVVTCTVLP
jgi:hypothetical protein